MSMSTSMRLTIGVFSMAPPCIDMGQEQTCSGVWDLQFEYPVSRNSVLRVTGQNGT